MADYDLVGVDETEAAQLLATMQQLPNKAARLEHARALLNSHPSLSTVTRPTLATQPTLTKRNPRARGIKRQDRNDKAAFTGDGSNMRCGTSGGKSFLMDQLWWAAVPSNRDGGRMEPVIGGLDQMPGKYGTNTQFLQVPESFTGLVG